MKQFHRLVLGISGLVFSALTSTATASPYAQTNLVSDIAGLAQITDAALHNPWGISFNAASPFWVSDQGTNNATLYRITNGVVAPVVASGGSADIAIPTTLAGPQGPTGQVFNSAGAAFVIGANPANFIFANLNGTIAGWNTAAGATAQVAVTTPGAVYTGLAITGTGANALLFAANGAGTGSIDVFNSSFTKVTVPGGFIDNDPRLAGLVPFNVTTIGGSVYVTYAPAGGRPNQIGAVSGQGAVAVFNTSGQLVATLIAGAGDHLASPWGVALAPGNFGQFSNDLLVGNFSFALSEINAFDPVTGAFLGTLTNNAGQTLITSPFASNGLWALEFGNGVTAPTNALLFAAGINSEADGLVGMITAVPEPESVALLGIGLIAMLAGVRRRRRA
jgi:uncharacterized protein (TIGR03118 family)